MKNPFKTIKELEEKVKQLEKLKENYSIRFWKLENRPKFKVGDKVDSIYYGCLFAGALVVDVYHEVDYRLYFTSSVYWRYRLIHESEKIDMKEDMLILSK